MRCIFFLFRTRNFTSLSQVPAKMPGRHILCLADCLILSKEADEEKTEYLKSLFHTVYLADVIKRNHIKKHPGRIRRSAADSGFLCWLANQSRFYVTVSW